MPPLVVCHRPWPLLATDDVPFLSLPAALAHTVYTLVLSLLLPSDLYSGHLRLPLQLLLTFFATACTLEWAMVWYGSRGTPLECHKRRRMPLLLLLHAVASLGELATTIVVTILLLTARAAVAQQRAQAAGAAAPGMDLCSLAVSCAPNQQGFRSHWQAGPQLLRLPPAAADWQQQHDQVVNATFTSTADTTTTTSSSSERAPARWSHFAWAGPSPGPPPNQLKAAGAAAAGAGVQLAPVAVVQVPLALLHVVVWSSWGLQLLNLLLVAFGLWTLPQYRRGTDVWESRMQLLVSLVRGRAHIDALAPSSEPLLTPSSQPLSSRLQQARVGGRLRDKWRKRHPLRRIGRVLSRLTAPCNLTPSDVVTGAVLAAAAQRQRRKRALLEALQQQESMQLPADGVSAADPAAAAAQWEDMGGNGEVPTAATWGTGGSISRPTAATSSNKPDTGTVFSDAGLPSFSAHADHLPEPPASPFKAFSAGRPYAAAAEVGTSQAVSTCLDVQHPAGPDARSSDRQAGMDRGHSTSSILKTKGRHSRQPSRQAVQFTIPEGRLVTETPLGSDTQLSRDQTSAQPDSQGLFLTSTEHSATQQHLAGDTVGQPGILNSGRSGSLVSAVSRQLSWFLNSQGSWGSWASDDTTLAPDAAADTPAAPEVKEQDEATDAAVTGASRGDDAAAAAEGTAGKPPSTDSVSHPSSSSIGPGAAQVSTGAVSTAGSRGGPDRRVEGGAQPPRSFSAAGAPSLVLPPDRQYTLMRPQVHLTPTAMIEQLAQEGDVAAAVTRLQSDRQEVPQQVLAEAAHYGRFATAVYATLPRLPRAAGSSNPLAWLSKRLLPRRKRTTAAAEEVSSPTTSQPVAPNLVSASTSASSASTLPAAPAAASTAAAAAAATGNTTAGGAATGAAQRLSLEGMAEGLLLEQLVATAGLSASDVVYLNLQNACEGALPFYVAVDGPRRAVVVAVRGTFSIEDTVTDVLCLPVNVAGWLPPFMKERLRGCAAHLEVHAGMLEAADTILSDLGHKNILVALLLGQAAHDTDTNADVGLAAASGDTAASHDSGSSSGSGSLKSSRSSNSAGTGVPAGFVSTHKQGGQEEANLVETDLLLEAGQRQQHHHDCRGWRLVVTGHSLGAGVAALLALQLKQQFPNTTCWAFAPPGGLMSPALSAAVGDFVTSVVTGKDLVPRLSLVTLEQLRDDIMTSLARCRYSKARVLLGSLSRTNRLARADQVLLPYEQLPRESRWALNAYHSSLEGAPQPPEMLPPGRVLFLAPHKTLVSSTATPTPTSGSAGSSGAAACQRVGVHPGCDAASTVSAPAMQGAAARGACSSSSSARTGATGAGSSSCVAAGLSDPERQPLLPTEPCSGQEQQQDGPPGRCSWWAWWQQVTGWKQRRPPKQQPTTQQRMFRAVWVGPEELLAEGVLLSSHMMEDHSLLVTVPLLKQLGGQH